MWKDKIKEIIYMLENSDINEIEVRFWFKKIKVTKKPPVLNVDPEQLSSKNLNIYLKLSDARYDFAPQ